MTTEKFKKQKQKKITAIIDMVNEVYEELGGGHVESTYQEALGVLFREGKIDYTSEQNVEVLFHNQKVGTHRLDFIVDGEIIIELKRAASITKQTLAQARSYMNTLEMPYSIIINFPFDEEEGVQIEELGDVEIAEEFAPNDEQYKKEFAFLED